MGETQGQQSFRRELLNAVTGRCLRCGRVRNKQSNWCCRMCRERYAGHSKLCRKNNPEFVIAS